MPKDSWGGDFDYPEIRQQVTRDPSTTDEDEAVYVLANVAPDFPPNEWSKDAYYWGMEGRGYSREEAESIITNLGAAGLIHLTEEGHIQYPPPSSADQPAPEIPPQS